MVVRFPFVDPVLVTLPGGLELRWYGLAYLAAFVVAERVLHRLARAGRFPATPRELWDLVSLIIVGVLVGGRLGEALFHTPRLLLEPLSLLKFWEGGRSFHGGLLGAAVAIVVYMRAKGRSVLAAADGVALATLPGLFFGRVANFINGELYGRVAGSHALFKTRFPTDPLALEALGLDGASRRAQEEGVLRAFREGQWDAIAERVPYRHATQLYEALGESLLVGVLSYVAYRVVKPRRAAGDGLFFGLFLMIHGLTRLLTDWLREPGAALFASVTSGQVLSCAMLVAGAAIVRRARRHPEEARARGSFFFG